MRQAVFILIIACLSACQPGLERQPKISGRGYFERAIDVRSPPQGSVEFVQTARSTRAPPLTRGLFHRGRERYEIYCSVCHGYSGNGDGMATTRGFERPQPFTPDSQSLSQIYTVIRNGKNAMKGFSNRIPPDDTWAIAAYVLALKRRKR